MTAYDGGATQFSIISYYNRVVVMQTTRFPVGSASFFGVLEVIEVLDEPHLLRGTANGRRFIRVAGSRSSGCDLKAHFQLITHHFLLFPSQ